MVKPLIPSNQEYQPELSFSEKFIQKTMQIYANILGKKSFEESIIQKDDHYIVKVVQESYASSSLRQRVIGSRKIDQDLNEELHVAYVDTESKRVLICYRGTDFTNVKDIFSDLQIVLWVSVIDMRVKESRYFYDQVVMKYPTYEKRVSGHSLGGTISYLVTKHRNPDRCIVFNPGAAPSKGFISMMQDTLFKKSWTKNITTYKIFGDIISTFSFVGNVKTFFLKTVDIMKLHSINSFPELFDPAEKEI